MENIAEKQQDFNAILFFIGNYR